MTREIHISNRADWAMVTYWDRTSDEYSVPDWDEVASALIIYAARRICDELEFINNEEAAAHREIPQERDKEDQSLQEYLRRQEELKKEAEK